MGRVGGSLRTREFYVVRTQNRVMQTSERTPTTRHSCAPADPSVAELSSAGFPREKAGCPRGSQIQLGGHEASGWRGDEQGKGGESHEGEVLPAQWALMRPRLSAQTCSLP